MKTTIPLVLLVICLLVAHSPVTAATAPAGAIDFAALDRVITAQMAKHGLPGALAVIQGDAIVYQQGYGTAGPDRYHIQRPFCQHHHAPAFPEHSIDWLSD